MSASGSWSSTPGIPANPALDELFSRRESGAQHALGKGRYRRRSTLNKVAPVAAAAIGTLALVGSAGWGAFTGLQDQLQAAPRETVVVEIEPPAQHSDVVAAAKSTCDALTSDALITVDAHSEEEEAALDAFEALEEALAEVTTVTDTVFVLEGVPEDLIQSYNDSEVSLRKLFAAASQIRTAPRADTESVIAAPVVKAPVTESVTEGIVEAARTLDEAIAKVPVTQRASLLGPEAIDPETLTDEELESLINAGHGEVFQVEKDRRLAESLPDLSQMKNGYIDDSLLCPVPWAPDYRLLCVTVPNLIRLNDAFKKEFGHDVSIQSGYRTFDQQVMAHQSAPYMTTLPGTSNHSWGLAVDFDIAQYKEYDHPEVVWLVENAPSYGWRNPTHDSFETANPEPWHFEFGTVYDGPNDGFNGPAPEVKYLFKLPAGSRTKTLLSDE